MSRRSRFLRESTERRTCDKVEPYISTYNRRPLSTGYSFDVADYVRNPNKLHYIIKLSCWIDILSGFFILTLFV